MRTRWVGSYTGLYGRVRISARHDSLIVALEGRELGRLLYQGGGTFVASFDHGIRIVFGAGGVPVEGFSASRRKRVLMYRRGGGRRQSPPAGPAAGGGGGRCEVWSAAGGGERRE